MDDMVEGPASHSPQRWAFAGLPRGMARDGRGKFSRRAQAAAQAKSSRVGVGDGEDCSRSRLAVDCCAPDSGGTGAAARVDGSFRSDLSFAFRQLSTAGTILAGEGHRRRADYVEADPLEIAE